MQLMGRVSTKLLTFKFDAHEVTSAKLSWLHIERGGQYGGELLAAFELYLVRALVCLTL